MSPDAGGSAELLSSQAEGIPVNTKAPEEYLPKGTSRTHDTGRRSRNWQVSNQGYEKAQIHHNRVNERNGDVTPVILIWKCVDTLP